VDVLDDRAQVVVSFDDPRFETALKEVALAEVATVEPHRVKAVQALHPA